MRDSVDPTGERLSQPDEALYRAYLKQGDNEALGCLLECYRESLTLFLFGFVRSAEDAEELMLDAFAELAAGPTAFSGRSSFKTWLFSVGKHLALRSELERMDFTYEAI